MFGMLLFLNTVLFILIPSSFPAGGNSYSVDDGKFKENQKLHSMLLVVTLDGQLIAFDASNNILWTKINNQPLLATSQPKLLYTKNGKTVRAIPSLTGGLFECERNSLAQLPYDYNQNQWKLSNTTTVKTKLQTSFSILDPWTGRELFYGKCIDRNCNALLNSYVLNFTSTITKKFIVEKRVTQIVGLEENKSNVSEKRWSYIVTDVQLRSRFPKRFKALSERLIKCDKESLSYIYHNYNICLGKFHMKQRSSNESQFLHSHHLQSPIAFAWIYIHGKLCKLDLFQTCHTTPDLETSIPVSSSQLFVGRYHDQVYLQTFRLGPILQEKVTVWSKKLQNDLYPDFCQQCKCSLLSQPAATDIIDKYIKPNICIEAHLATLNICLDDSNFENDFYVDKDWNGCTNITMPFSEEQCLSKTDRIATLIWFYVGSGVILLFVLVVFLVCNLAKCSYRGLLQIQRRLRLKQRKRTRRAIAKAKFDITFHDCAMTPKEGLFLPKKQREIAVPQPQSNRLESIASTDLEEECEFNFMPRLLQDFELLSKLGYGGFGTVFKVKHNIDQSIYAVKCIKLDPNETHHYAKRLRESKVLAQLQHENIIRYYWSWIETSSEDLSQAMSDVSSCNSSSGNKLNIYENFDSTDGSKYLCIQTEQCDCTLNTWLKKNKTIRKFSKNKSLYLSIFSQILCGVNYIHVNGFVHLDLKPSNILFKGQTVKIADFGLVKGSDLHLSTERVATSALGRYVAPEWAKGKENLISNKADIYSLGMIFFEMILPPCKTVHELIDVQLQLKKYHKFPKGFQSQHPTNSQMISQMVQKDPEARPSVAEIIQNASFSRALLS